MSSAERNASVARQLFLPHENAKKCGGHCAKLSTERLKIAYCDSECQKKDWKAHKSNCSKGNVTELGSFYPLIAFIAELQRNEPFKPSHHALGHQIVNSPNPWNEESMLGLSVGSACRLIALGNRIMFPTMGPAPANWWPTAQSDQTTTSTANSVGGPEEGRGRVRLIHHGTQIADFGIVKGRANVKAQDHFMYLFLNYGAVFEKGQDPNNHYWIYFTTVNGVGIILDCGMFVFNNPLFVVPFPHYTKFIPSSLPGITAPAVPAYFAPREATKRGWIPKAHHEQQRFSVLRDKGLREAVRFSHKEF